MRLSSFAGTDVGRARSGNEDSYFCGRTVLAVADGLGGHQGGEVASAAAVEPLAALDGREFADPAEAAEELTAAIREANAAILDRAAGDPGLWGMGTTVTAAAVAGDHLQLAHVGDSRAYLLRDGSFDQVTTDHTVVGELVRRGRLTPAQAAVHPERSILTRAVGLDPRIPVDTPDPIDLRPGDQVLLCSDGLTEAVPDPQIAELLATNPDGDAACRALIDTANNAGGPDNITLVLIRVE
ncbi:MAG: Stp1/IreP family PP2C-type Ser/Thr phosphatase [Actinomycetota bacterium]